MLDSGTVEPCLEPPEKSSGSGVHGCVVLVQAFSYMKIFQEILADHTDAFKLGFGHNSCFDDVFRHVQFGISMKIFGLRCV